MEIQKHKKKYNYIMQEYIKILGKKSYNMHKQRYW